MKTTIRLFITALLLFSNSVFAGGIFLQLSDSRGNVDPVVKQQIQQLLGDAIANGTVVSMVTYNQGLQFNNQLAMCADSSGNATRFKRLFDNLRDIKARASASYQVKMQDHCSKDTTLVCLSGFAGCVNSSLANSSVYSELIAAQQFANGLADILSGKAVMELKFTKDIDVLSPSEIGLPNNTKHCSVITAVGEAYGTATITCTIIGNANILDKTITLIRNMDANGYFIWTCISDADPKYVGRCTD